MFFALKGGFPAVRGGSFAPERVAAYVALASEMRANAASLDPDIVL